MKKLILAISINMIFSNGIFSQDTSHNSLSLNWGVGNIQRQDLTFSPMIHRDWSPINFVLCYARSKKFEQQVYVKFGIYNPIVGDRFTYTHSFTGEETSTNPHNFIVADINYSFGKKIAAINNWNVNLGGRLRNRFNPSIYNFGPAGSSGYYFAFGLDIWSKVEYTLKEKHHFVSNIGIPIFSWVARSPYLSQDDEYFSGIYSHKGFKSFISNIKSGEIQSWGKSQSFDFDLRYSYLLSDKWSIGGSYWFSLNINQQPTKFTSIENVFFLTGEFKF